MKDLVPDGKPSQEAIARRAYWIWLDEGCPQGRDLSHWTQAEAELTGEEQDAEISS